MERIIAETLWFLLPAMIANMAPVIAARYAVLSQLAKPLDGGMSISGRRLLGSHKTVRGVVVGILAGSATAFAQTLLYVFDIGRDIALVPYTSIVFALVLGGVLGLGALTGDAVKSFIKRRIGILPGNSFPVFDQIDFVIGAALAAQLVVPVSFTHIIVAVIIIGIGSYVVSNIGVALRIKKTV